MARFLASLAPTSRLNFPLTLVHDTQPRRQEPDFLLQQGLQEIGVECVVATPTEHRHIEYIRNRQFPDKLIFGQRYDVGKSDFDLQEKRDIASGESEFSVGKATTLTFWTHRSMVKNWVEAMEHTVKGKAKKRKEGKYSAANAMWLLVQDEWPNPLRLYPNALIEAASWLQYKLRAFLGQDIFHEIAILSGDYLLTYSPRGASVHENLDLWPQLNPSV